MSYIVNFFRSVLFFALMTQGFQSVSDDGGSFVIPDSIGLGSQPSLADLEEQNEAENKQVEKLGTLFEDNLRGIERPAYVIERVKPKSDLCAAAASPKGLNFKTPTSYLSSVLKKAGAVEKEENLFDGHANNFWKDYLEGKNFKDLSENLAQRESFNFDQLENGSVIILEESCFKEGTAAIYCDGKYFATTFVKPSSLLKKVNSANHKCRLGAGLRIVIEENKNPESNSKSLARAY